MVVKKEVYYEKDFHLLDLIQYILAVSITILFGLSLIPFLYSSVSNVLVTVLVIQILISLIRLKIPNFFLELILLAFALISYITIIPVVFEVIGYLFRFFGVLFGLIEMLLFKNSKIFKKVEIITTNKFKRKTIKKTKKQPKGFKEAKFKEK